jgi:hypothetical protein
MTGLLTAMPAIEKMLRVTKFNMSGRAEIREFLVKMLTICS